MKACKKDVISKFPFTLQNRMIFANLFIISNFSITLKIYLEKISAFKRNKYFISKVKKFSKISISKMVNQNGNFQNGFPRKA